MIPNRKSRDQGSIRNARRPRRYCVNLESLEARQLLTAFTVNDPLDLPDANPNDGLALTASNTTTMRSVAEQAAHDNLSVLDISFSGVTNIPTVTGNFAPFTVNMNAPGVSIGSALTFGAASNVTGVGFTAGLTVGAGSQVSSATVGGSGLGISSNTKVQSSTINGSITGSSNNTVTGSTITGTVTLTGGQNTITSNQISAGGISLVGTLANPTANNQILSNTVSGGSGIGLAFAQDSAIRDNVVSGSSVAGITIDNEEPSGDPNIPPTHLAGRNAITGNRVGFDAGGTAVGNATGIRIVGSSFDSIGGATAGLGNKVVKSTGAGMEISGDTGFLIQGNEVGTNAAGAANLGNGGHGIDYLADNGQIGGVGVAANIIGGNGGLGLRASGSSNAVQGNFVGTNTGYSIKRGNDQGGISLTGNFNTVGGSTTLGLGNTIAGNNGNGVLLQGAMNFVQGNAIGNRAGATTLGNNGIGIFASGSRNTLGGVTADLGNTITGNVVTGITLNGSDARVWGNYIGTNAAGANLGNLQFGIQVGGQRHQIGDTNGTGLGNTIAFNGSVLGARGYGVWINNGTGHTVRLNSIYSNTGRGIALGDVRLHVNDAGINDFPTLTKAPDLDTGPNNLQNFPVALGMSGAQVRWMLNSQPNTTYTIDVYSNTAPHSSGFGDGRTYVQTLAVTTDAFGHVEFNTPSGSNLSLTATDPNGNTSDFSMVDTDFDGLADTWETNGIDVNEDGTIDLTLPGADPRHKDIFIEADAMQGLGPVAANVTGVPAGLATGTSLDYVIRAFANAPAALVQNPDGAAGINLHVLYDEKTIPRAIWSQRNADGWPSDFDTLKQARFGTAAERSSGNAQNILKAKSWTYRYATIADTLQGTSIDVMASDLSGTDLILFAKDLVGADGNLGTADDYPDVPNAQAGVFMHGLGHLLGLTHGGGAADWNGQGDQLNNKPNYHSVMNPLWATPLPNPSNAQEQAYHDSWRLDYSRRAFPTLNEASLTESAGIGGDAGNTLRLAIGTNRFVSETGAVDWNGNGTTTDQINGLDINGDGQIGTLAGREDWSQLRYYFLESANAAGARHPQFDNLISPPGGPPPAPVIDLSIGQQGPAGAVTQGDNLTFTLTVHNNGPDVANGVSVVDTLPAGLLFQSATTSQGTFSQNNGVVTFSLGTLASSGIATLTVVAKANATGSLRNTVTVGPTTNDPNTANNTSLFDVTVNPPPTADLLITQQANTAQLTLGQSVTYTLFVTNNGPDATNATVTDGLPAGFVFQSATTSQGTFSVDANGVVTFSLGSLAASATATLTITATPGNAGGYRNTASVTGLLSDPNSGNNAASFDVNVLPKPVRATNVQLKTIKLGKKREQVIVISFDGALNAATAKTLSFYRLAAAGKDKKFGTKDDPKTPLRSATFDANTNSVIIRLKKPPLKPAPALQLAVTSGGLRDTLNRAIDGDHDGNEGGNVIALVAKGRARLQ